MRVAVLSDIHGNLAALQAVVDDMQAARVDHILVAGDLIGGPQPNETIALLQSLDPIVICGNTDTGLIRYMAGQAPVSRRTHLQFALLRWSARNVQPATLRYLESLPEQRIVELLGRAPIRLVHGTPRDPAESIYPDSDPAVLHEALASIAERVLLCGHTHEPWKREVNGRLALNPGAVCGPLDGFVGAQYALVTWDDGGWAAEHRGVHYKLESIRGAFRDSGLLEQGGALARAFLASIETGRDVGLHFLTYAQALTAEAGYRDYDAVPDPVWVEASETFDWDGGATPGAL